MYHFFNSVYQGHSTNGHHSIVQVPSHAFCRIIAVSLIYYINITFPERVIVEKYHPEECDYQPRRSRGL